VSVPPPIVGPDSEEVISPLRDAREDTKFASGKIAFFQYLSVGVFVFLISGFWVLQVSNPQYYSELAERNRIKSIPILAPRGRILDRDGRVIVDNHASFGLILSRENLNLEHLQAIAQGLDMDYDTLLKRLQKRGSQPSYQPVLIKEDLSPENLAFVESHKDFFPEMDVIESQQRLYPQNGMLAHVIGYTGEISEDELSNPALARYEPGDVIGKFGIEREYNDVLTGVDGERQEVVDSRGKIRTILGTKAAVPGKDLKLTIDLDLQVVAELAMEGKDGAVVALDPRTGEVLAMVSRPTFDPNQFAGGINAAAWAEIAQNPAKPLLNRAIQGQLAPGSTFKPLMALMGLETGTIDDQFTVGCPGGASFYGHYFKCWQKGGHGRISLHRAIVQSCDVYFYNVGNRAGIDRIAQYAHEFGLGEKTGVDLPHEASGVVPSTQWKMRNFRQKWYAGETISVSIGQGALTVTPLQLARATGGLAVGGVWQVPHLLRSLTGKEKPRSFRVDPENVAKVVDGMCGVVNEGGGTGGRARLPGIEVCGKTGSAQLASNQFLKSAGHGRTLRDNSWFVGFAPRQPEIVVAALYENGEHGYLSAPVVRDVIKAYFDKKARRAGTRPASSPPPQIH
jgi:penicillin-binding protein 2